ncbi:MAG: glutathione S-transferase family protein [Alphaproteobacteria bacterium]|jgi:glutathione S-transferase|nr:glutathione S-transferase family protein [Alphaproteobacteria bacterium]
MKIYWIKAQAPRRVLALAKHLQIAAEFVELDLMVGELQRPQYAAINPNMKVPTLVDGETVVLEASAIMAYLCILARSDMWPADSPLEQVEILRWLSWGDGHWSPAVAPFYFEYIVKSTFDIGEPDPEALKSKVTDLRKYAAILDRHLEETPYVACNRLTIADFQLASMAAYWRQAKMPLEDFKHITTWLDRLMQLPAWADPWPQKNVVG